MITRDSGAPYSVRLAVPWADRMRAWGAVRSGLERQLAEQESSVVIVPGAAARSGAAGITFG
jgi:hypothetical protein